MVNIIKITDLTAPELAVYTQLTQAQLRSRVAPERALFIAESPKVIGTALDAGCQPVSFLMEREKITGQASALLDVPRNEAYRMAMRIKEDSDD